MSAAAYPPAGRLKVLPAEGRSSGWEARRFSMSSRIRARISSGCAGVSFSVAAVTSAPEPSSALWR